MATKIRVIEEADPRPLDNSTSRVLRETSKIKPAHIVAILPRGEAIRNFVYTGALDDILKVANVSLLSVIPSSDLRDLLDARYTNVFQLEEISEKRAVRSIREILDMAHGRWLWSEAAQERWRMRDREATNATLRVKRLAKKFVSRPFANRAGLEFLSTLERKTSRWLSSTDYYVRLFKELKPSLVFNGSHVHARIAVQPVQAAQWLGIPTAAFVFSWDNLTSQGRIVPPYDYYLVWNSGIREHLLQLYPSVRPDQVLITGTPQFDFHFRREFYWTREEFCEKVGADPSRPIVLYTTGMANHMPGEPSIVEEIAKMLRGMTELGPPQLIVRIYPKDRSDRFNEVKERYPEVLFPKAPWEPGWLTPKFEDAYLLTNMLRHAAVGINIASTVSLELCMFDKPVINVAYNPRNISTEEVDFSRYYQFDHYRPVVESGAIVLAYSEDDLRWKLTEALMHAERRSTERRALVRQFFGHTLDGWSSRRVAEVLSMLVSRNEGRRR